MFITSYIFIQTTKLRQSLLCPSSRPGPTISLSPGGPTRQVQAIPELEGAGPRTRPRPPDECFLEIILGPGPPGSGHLGHLHGHGHLHLGEEEVPHVVKESSQRVSHLGLASSGVGS